jgi:hypothetical protein
VDLKTGEQLLLNEGKIGWHRTLGLTNERLNRETIEREIRLSDILEVYPKTQGFTGLTQLGIKLMSGTEESIVFKTGDADLLLGGLNFAGSNATNMTNRYVNLINRVLNQKASEIRDKQEQESKIEIFNKQLLDMQEFLKSVYRIKRSLYPLQLLELDIKEKESTGKTREQAIQELYMEKVKKQQTT